MKCLVSLHLRSRRQTRYDIYINSAMAWRVGPIHVHSPAWRHARCCSAVVVTNSMTAKNACRSSSFSSPCCSSSLWPKTSRFQPILGALATNELYGLVLMVMHAYSATRNTQGAATGRRSPSQARLAMNLRKQFADRPPPPSLYRSRAAADDAGGISDRGASFAFASACLSLWRKLALISQTNLQGDRSGW